MGLWRFGIFDIAFAAVINFILALLNRRADKVDRALTRKNRPQVDAAAFERLLNRKTDEPNPKSPESHEDETSRLIREVDALTRNQDTP